MEPARSPAMSKKVRRHYTTEQKVALLKRHMVDKVPVSDLCNEEDLPPSVFYRWQSLLFENLGAALSTPAAVNGPSKREKEQAQELAQLKARLAKKDQVIAEISEEYVNLKKELGEP
jgi:transposase-like protein